MTRHVLVAILLLGGAVACVEPTREPVVEIDAAPAPPDARPPRPDGGGEEVLGLGKICNIQNACPAAAPECITLQPAAANGFCSLPCGTTPAAQTTPPAGSDALCAAQFTALNSGTPQCTLSKVEADQRLWTCAIRCDLVGNVDYGYCPAQMTCVANLCQPL